VQKNNTRDMPVHPEIRRVVSFKGGTATLETPSGERPSEHVTRLEHLPQVPTLASELAFQLDLVDFGRTGVLLDPCSASVTVTAAMQAAGYTVVRNDLRPQREAELHMDALQPGFYRQMQLDYGRIDVTIFSAWFAYLDVSVPMAVAHSAVAAFAHVPGHFITDAHPALRAWLRELRLSGRLQVMGLPRGPLGRRCCWLGIFASAPIARRMLRNDFYIPYLEF
jgi:hypothetical protein